MEQMQNFLFIAYLLKHREHEVEVIYHGCRGIVIPDYKTPIHIRGMMEFEGALIPVIDPGIFFHNRPANVTNAACILIVEHAYESRTRRTGVIIEDFDEIMNLAAGGYSGGESKLATFNMRFVLEMSRNAAANRLLCDTHLALEFRERQRQADADFAAFQNVATRSKGWRRASHGLSGDGIRLNPFRRSFSAWPLTRASRRKFFKQVLCKYDQVLDIDHAVTPGHRADVTK